ncbi:MAG: sulfite exporter TauE/SafE family protein [Gemmatimonadota bacterium]|nr:sulfite exporter TauE/SafE family protein [Gemmatimonadota bacterium]
MTFQILLAITAAVAGAVASVVGFGIGSLLTPLLAVRVGTQLAVAAISIPHVFATALRFWRLRAHVDRRVLVNFGVMSAAGGLAGALLHAYANNRALSIAFGLILIFVGVSEVTGIAPRMRFHGAFAWIAGGVSGLFGGLVGNQGGIRSAALWGSTSTSRHSLPPRRRSDSWSMQPGCRCILRLSRARSRTSGC